jgi:hypothetical protein
MCQILLIGASLQSINKDESSGRDKDSGSVPQETS